MGPNGIRVEMLTAEIGHSCGKSSRVKDLLRDSAFLRRMRPSKLYCSLTWLI